MNAYALYVEEKPYLMTDGIMNTLRKANAYGRQIIADPGDLAFELQGTAMLTNQTIKLHIAKPGDVIGLLHDRPIYLVTDDLSKYSIKGFKKMLNGKWSTSSIEHYITIERL